jgi:hypothetical protein
MLVTFVAPRLGFGLICGALILLIAAVRHRQPGVGDLRSLAEGEGFEPPVRFPVQRFSRYMD